MAILSQTVNRETVEKIHSSALYVLENKGICFHSEKAVKIFKDNGFRVDDDNVVYMKKDDVEKALSTAPSRFVLRGREEKYDVEIGGEKPAYIPAYGPVFVSRNNQRRRADHEDLINFNKLVQTSRVINVLNPYVVAPEDVPEDRLLMYQMASCLRYGSKPTMGIAAGYEDAKRAIAMVKAANGRGEDDYVTIGLISALSPLAYADNMAESLIAYAEEKQPVVLGCGALPGATSPVSITGTMVTATAELLAGIVMAQLICPGLPCVYGNMAAGTDLRFVTPAIGTPEGAKIIAISNAMADFYGIPCRGGGTVCDAKETDFQAGSEGMLMMLATVASKTDFIIHAAGIMDSFNIIGYEKFLLDEQCIEEIEFFLKDCDLSDDVLGMETIMEVPHGKQYLEEDHTFDYMHDELYMPKVSLRGIYQKWVNEGSPSLLKKANEEIDRRIASYVEPELDEAVKAELDQLLHI